MEPNNQSAQQAVVVSQPNLAFNRSTTRLALFNEDGTPAVLSGSDPNVVKVTSQSLTSGQQAQARNNIGVASPFGPLTGSVTQGLYARTIPTHASLGGTTFSPVINDPNVPGRIWGQRNGTSFGHVLWSDDHGVTVGDAGSLPAGGTAGLPSMEFGSSYVFITQGPGGTARDGTLWRSPLPAANGSGLSWTKVFDLASPPSGVTTGDNSIFKAGGLAVNGTNVYLAEYSLGSGASTGGPRLYYSADSGATWSTVKQWANAKHCHDVRVINGVPWVSMGDPGAGLTDIGLWSATSAAATTWNQRNLWTEAVGGNTYYPIGFFGATVAGTPMIFLESDGDKNLGPLVFPTQSTGSTKRAFHELCRIPFPLLGTMRSLTLTSEGNLMWLHTGENGAVGPWDSVCIAKGPNFSEVVILEQIASSGSVLIATRKPVEDGPYVWIGTSRITKEKFAGQ